MTNAHSKPVHIFHVNTDKGFLMKNNIASTSVKTIQDSITYEILHYDDNTLCHDDNIRRTYNSVIIQPQSIKVLSLFTPKYSHITHFKSKNTFDTSLKLNVVVEGLQLQLFYEPRTFSWQIASKYCVGGNVMYQYNNTIMKQSEIFAQALGYSTYKLNDIPLLKTLPKQYCYHFILDHPAFHQDRQKCKNMAIFLANVIETEHNNEKNNIRLLGLPYVKYTKMFENTKVRYIEEIPNTYTSYQSCVFHTCSIYNNTPGIVIENIQSKECTIMKNPNNLYRNYIQYLNPQHIFESICINHSKTIDVLSEYIMIQKYIVNTLHTIYMDTYVRKLQNIPYISKYAYHLQNIHKCHLSSLCNKKKRITKYVVMKYLNTLHPKEVFDLVYVTFENVSSS